MCGEKSSAVADNTLTVPGNYSALKANFDPEIRAEYV
jgi:hypothetical protein